MQRSKEVVAVVSLLAMAVSATKHPPVGLSPRAADRIGQLSEAGAEATRERPTAFAYRRAGPPGPPPSVGG